MPIFHDEPESLESEYSNMAWNTTEDAGREEEAPAMEKRDSPSPDSLETTLRTNNGRPVSREELIERLKRAQSPPWKVRHGVSLISTDRNSPRNSPKSCSPPSLLPAADIKASPKTQQQEQEDNTAAGMEIERPRSALHSGDFRKDSTSSHGDSGHSPIAGSPPAPWHAEISPFTGPRSFDSSRPPSRSRTGSIPALSNFVFMPPTSPLYHTSSTLDLESSSLERNRSTSPEMDGRRHTFSPRSFQTLHSGYLPPSSPSRAIPVIRREVTAPYQAHQPRRSISGFQQIHSKSNPQTPRLRPRRTSISSEASPLHHAPMVGSYEESILRGRMSTTPSRPLDFVAQIGVLGKGRCRASLKCPPHVTLPFPAVFYSYNSGNGRISDDQPSPYVGMIDIEHSLPPYEENDGEGRRRRRYATPPNDVEGICKPLDIVANATSEGHSRALRIKKDNLKRRSQSPKAPPGGCYRIPQQGQLQIVLKNPNKTAVKLFLVPYDLSDMEPGQKTFIRQRSYSAGPIIDMPLSSRKNFGTERPEAALSYSEDPRERPTLRYLIHIHICCPAKGRYFLYKHIRVVFANRVPDGKEKLRNEVQLPDPKYSTYKPSRDSTGGHLASSHHLPNLAGTMAMNEKRDNRRKNPLFFETDNLDAIDGLQDGAPSPNSSFYTTPARVRPIPFSLQGLETLVSRPASRDRMEMDGSHKAMGQLSKDSTERLAQKQTADKIETEHAVPGIQGWGQDAWKRP